MDLALNNLERLMCQQTNQPTTIGEAVYMLYN